MVESRFPAFRVVRLDRNYGFAEGNNRAAQQAAGEWIGFLNNDMAVPGDWLTKLTAPLNEMPGLSCLASRILNRDGSAIDFIGGSINFQGHGLQLDYGKKSSSLDIGRRLLFPCGGAMLVRRQIFLDAGGFDPSYFAFFEDVDLGWRLNLMGHDTWYVPDATVFHDHHGTANRIPEHQRRLLSERNALFTIYKNYDDANLALVLPVALMLLNEKALRISGLDPVDFQPGAPSMPRQTLGRPEPQPAHGLIQRGIRVARNEGIAALARKGLRKVRHLPPVGNSVTPTVDGAGPKGAVMLPLLAASHLAAVSDLAHSLEQLAVKRRDVQSQRRRTDDEVLSLAGVQIRDPSYLTMSTSTSKPGCPRPLGSPSASAK